jgi:hypothetical protein
LNWRGSHLSLSKNSGTLQPVLRSVTLGHCVT